MSQPTDTLAELYSKFLTRQGEEWRASCSSNVDRQRRRALLKLERRGINTVSDLVAGYVSLPPRLKLEANDLIAILGIRQAAAVLLAAMEDSTVRLSCADILAQLDVGSKVTRVFCAIGRRELASDRPDADWLAAVTLGLTFANDRASAEVLVSIFERRDLPGPIRGDAGDKLGCCSLIYDRRKSLYRRCRQAALRGLTDESPDVQFWSMYVIASLCNVAGSRRQVDPAFRAALPRLREIAASDHRLAAGFWWPISAEAEDAIACIVNGIWPDPDAGDRWLDTRARIPLD